MREAYHRVAGAIEHVPDERLLEPAMDNWTGKDLLAHMAWWHDHSVDVIVDESDPANTPTRSTSGPAASTWTIHSTKTIVRTAQYCRTGQESRWLEKPALL